MLNITAIQGRFVNDPELRKTQSGTSVCSFTLACERDVKTADGQKREVDFFDMVAWNGTAEHICRVYKKGRAAIATGRLRARNWEASDGTRRRSLEIQVEKIYPSDYRKPSDEPLPEEQPPDIIGGTEEDLPF